MRCDVIVANLNHKNFL